MKEYKVFIKENVYEKLDEILEYNFNLTFDYDFSQKFVYNIIKEIYSLQVFPNRYTKYNSKYRVFLVFKKYKVFYRVDEENSIVVVNNIFSTSENYFQKNF